MSTSPYGGCVAHVVVDPPYAPAMTGTATATRKRSSAHTECMESHGSPEKRARRDRPRDGQDCQQESLRDGKRGRSAGHGRRARSTGHRKRDRKRCDDTRDGKRGDGKRGSSSGHGKRDETRRAKKRHGKRRGKRERDSREDGGDAKRTRDVCIGTSPLPARAVPEDDSVMSSRSADGPRKTASVEEVDALVGAVMLSCSAPIGHAEASRASGVPDSTFSGQSGAEPA